MVYSTSKKGNLVLTFNSPIGLERSATPDIETLSEGTESTMELWADNQGAPMSIEWNVPELDFYAEIGLEFDGQELVDYDGVFELPKEAIKLIRKAGYTVPKHFED